MAIKAEIGDVVHVRGTLIADAPHPCVRFWETDAIEIPKESIVHVEPQPLKVGDEAIHTGYLVKILAIDGNDAWVRLNVDGQRITVTFDKLKRGLLCADEPRPLKVGDKVRHKDGMIGVISSITNDNHARVDTGGNCYASIARFEDLERVE